MSKTKIIDINADVGEGIGNESKLMPYLSSCNIACGEHAGDDSTIREAIKLAKKHNVKVGAHPSFPDRANFGRVIMEMSNAELYASLLGQILVLKYMAEAYDIPLNHIKPHGALYNLAAKDKDTATLIVEVIKSLNNSTLKLYAPYNSVLAKIAKQEEIEVVHEAFADRNYNEDLSLVSRKKNNAMLHNKQEVLQHVLEIVKHQKVKTISGVEVPIKAATLCVHGDTENALEILRYLNLEFPKNEIKIK
jgi:UPF0271 protein